MTIKQVIVVRRDLKMRRGKECAQSAHASMKWLVDRIRQSGFLYSIYGHDGELKFSDDELEWLTGKFTKICVQVDSETELLAVHKAAQEAGLTSSLIQDAGATEFNGVPTFTAVAIGPNDADAIDKITGNLKLY